MTRTNPYRQTIQIGDNATDILQVPCVMGVMKTMNQPPYDLQWRLKTETIINLCSCHSLTEPYYHPAYQGDWLCEDYSGQWHMLCNAEYQENIKGGDK